MTYDEDYFEDGIATGKSLYVNYGWIPDLTLPMAHELIEDLPILKTDVVLDFGCAKGYLVKALHMLGRKNAWGLDISDYAVSNVPSEVEHRIVRTLDELNGLYFDWIIAKDVLEHLEEDELEQTLEAFRKISSRCFIVVPLGDGERYNVPAYELDVTHKIRQDLGWWETKIEVAGFSSVKASTSWGSLKKKWDVAPMANGFFVCK